MRKLQLSREDCEWSVCAMEWPDTMGRYRRKKYTKEIMSLQVSTVSRAYPIFRRSGTI